MRPRSLLLKLAALTAVIGMAWSPAAAQITTGGITGKVVDEKGDPLSGVLVTARNRDTNLERAVTTDGKGEYRVLGLPPAIYIVQATITGYGAPPKTIVVNLGQLVPLNIELRAGGGLREELKVTAEPPLVNTTKSEIATVVTERDIRSYPLLNRDFTDLAALAPGVKQAPSGQFDPTKHEGIYTPFTTGGSSGRNINISIDGADNNDNVVGFFVQGFTAEAIQEYEVVQDQYKAEYGRSFGGVVNIVTKSGTNDFGGSVFGVFRNESLRAKTFSERLAASEKEESDRQQYGFSVGGPIIKDKLFYFAAYERQDEENPVVLSDILTGFSGSLDPNFPVQIASPGTTVPQDFKRDLWTIRLDWNAARDHLIWLRYSSDENEFTNDQGAAVTDPTNQGNSFNEIWSAVLNWQWTLRGNMINEFKIHTNDFENGIDATGQDRVDSLQRDILTLSYDDFDLGRNLNAPQSTIQKKFQVRDDFSWVRGRHSYKAGVEFVRVDLDDSFLGPAREPSLNFVFNSGVTPNDSLISGEDPNRVVPNVTDPNNGIDDGVEVVSELILANPGFIPGTDYTQYGLYFQDDWEFNDRWRFNLGIRLDLDRDIFKEAEEGINKDFYECFADPTDSHKCGLDPNTPNPTNPPAKFGSFDEKFPEDQTNLSPRLGFVYRVGGEDKDVVRGSWGLYYDKLVDNLVISMRQNLSPFFSPSAPTFAGVDPTDANTLMSTQLLAGTVVDPRFDPLPVDFTLANWLNSNAVGPADPNDPNSPLINLRQWFNAQTASFSEATFDDLVIMPSADWKTPYTSAFSFGWGHVFSPRLALDTNLIYRRGFRQLFRQEFGGRTSGRESPFAPSVDPNGVGAYGGRTIILTTEGKTQYISLQTSLKGRFPSFDFGLNLNIGQALGTQDNAGTQPGKDNSGPVDIFEGGNLQFTGGKIDSEWGRISGDQMLYAFLYGIYRFPLDFQAAVQIAYGTRTAFHGSCGQDCNGDGYLRREEYVGTRGSGLGDDLFNIDMRGSKAFDTGAGTKVELYLEVFNLLNRVNHGIFVLHRQLDSSGAPNPEYGRPTGDTLRPPRTAQVGLRFTF